ncbi:antibiotic biosynthesis monooxygenase family protein [Mesonia sp. MT50]|uniref:Antibiotic biosynthesis monooxygenase family protein n=1 Tax=Mesonia profundi TaxID=3070998 RepID=A0ABU0ZXH0_9FLAO|nr:antibiotic biosynthesis monooxygenase family protein [Mesonia profundi]MDQ7916141.1 antibiotic biosynthesis monooxygenase family protein [Mesonia profundi]
MIVRIVKMSFKEEEIENFLALFQSKKQYIRGFEGCTFLELYQDKHNPSIFFTYSYWESEANLESYRHSALFKEVWTATKIKFNAKPEAWSLDQLVSLK